MSETTVMPAFAKINLALDVLFRREDGYHEIEMVMQTIALHDLLFFQPVPDPEITLQCNNREIPAGEGNLAFKAALLLQSRYGVGKGVKIILKKQIPIAAGLAGGSSNAAAVLRALNLLWGLNLSLEELMALGLKLGADVPYCLQGGTCLARGIGERLTTLPAAPPFWVVLAKPSGGLSTGEVYKALQLDMIERRPNIPALLAAISDQSVEGIAAHLGNVLQEVSQNMQPEIARLQEKMEGLGVLGSVMTGSGPTVYGLVKDQAQAEAVARNLRKMCSDIQVIVSRTWKPSSGSLGEALGTHEEIIGTIAEGETTAGIGI